MSDSYKRLLPAPMPPGSAQAIVAESSFGKDAGPPVKKRTVSKAACNNCRLKKIRCDGKRPYCTACIRTNVECNFVTASSDETPFMALKREVESLRRSTEDLLEIMDLLESAPDTVSLDILRRLKSTRNHPEGANDPSEILASVKKDLGHESILPVKISNRQLIAGLIPETQECPEYELMMRCPTSYPTIMPLEIAFLNLADMLRPVILEQPKASSSVGRGDAASPSSVPGSSSEGASRNGITPTMTEPVDSWMGDFEPLQSTYSIVDDRLKNVNFRIWTSVPVTNELAASLVSLYLEIDHPWCPLFDADLFLNDCVDGTNHFCSPLLVNSLLGWACQSYATYQPEAATLVGAFETEAERLWGLEKYTNTLTAAAAAQLLNNLSASRGRDEFASQCLEEGIQMGKRMGLFGVGSETASALTWLDHHQDWLRAACHTSWGIFSYACMRSLHLHRAEIETPPLLPMPKEYFETHGYPNYAFSRTRGPVSTRVGEIFKAMCKFNLIVHDVIWNYYGKSDAVPAARATTEFAERTYQRLFEWARSLPLELARGRRNRHSTLMLHLYFHCTVMELFWPFLQQSADKVIKVDHFTTTTTMEHIHAASVNQLKRLALIYCINFNRICSATLWHIALLYLSNAMLCETMRSGRKRDSECWFYFMLCMTCYQNMYGYFRVVEVTMLGLLSMALRNGFLSTHEANTILKDMRKIGQRYDAPFMVRASFMVDLELAMTNPREAQVQTLADAFHELAIFREFTTGEYRNQENRPTRLIEQNSNS
ncbi:hypothetical protein GGR54DRAFT_584396 [Hypoxylon sp. NC1633]|nr:hypothetical protein GGR54DRAFT_584396 [Hypoxylon sp. NC1633]